MSGYEVQSKTFDALKALYDGQLTTLRSLSDRSFSTTLQAVALDLAVVAGLVASKVRLSHQGEAIAVTLLVIFHGLIAFYLVSKARAHHREKERLVAVQLCLAELADVESKFRATPAPSFTRSFLGGSGIFVAAVLLAGACAVAAVRVGLQA